MTSKRNRAIASITSRRSILLGSTTLAATSALGSGPLIHVAQAQQSASSAPASGGEKPNIMGDDIGWSNIGVYNQGIMAGRTPNLDRMANEGMRFTDYYAEASCTAGRPTTLLVNCRFGPALRRSDRPERQSASPIRP